MIKDDIQRIALILLAVSLVLCPIPVKAALHKTKVAVLPINVCSAGPFSYIGLATEEILSTRLASDRISVVDPLEVRNLIKNGSLSSLNIKDMAHRLGIEYILKGKITTKGKGIAMALDLLHPGSRVPVLSLVFSPKSLNEVLPEVEDFARQAKGRILSSPVAAHASENKGAIIPGVPHKEITKDKGIMVSRIHPDLLVRSSLKIPGRKKQVSIPLDKKIYARALLIPPPKPLKIHKIELAKRRALPPILPTPQAPAKKRKSSWFSWIMEFWGGKEALAKEPPRPALPYPPLEPGTGQASQGNEPIWQWY